MPWLEKDGYVHRCHLPGWRARRRAGINEGAVWECDEMLTDPDDSRPCGRRWTWNFSGLSGGWGWSRVYDKLPKVPSGPAPGARSKEFRLCPAHINEPEGCPDDCIIHEVRPPAPWEK